MSLARRVEKPLAARDFSGGNPAAVFFPCMKGRHEWQGGQAKGSASFSHSEKKASKPLTVRPLASPLKRKAALLRRLQRNERPLFAEKGDFSVCFRDVSGPRCPVALRRAYGRILPYQSPWTGAHCFLSVIDIPLRPFARILPPYAYAFRALPVPSHRLPADVEHGKNRSSGEVYAFVYCV